jgi:hypothetical protein
MISAIGRIDNHFDRASRRFFMAKAQQLTPPKRKRLI